MEEKKESIDEGLRREHPVAKVFGVFVTAVCAFAIGWLVKGMMPAPQSGGMPPGMMPPPPGDPLVAVERAELGVLNPPVEFIGRVEPIRAVDLGARISGYVVRVNFIEGALVREGETLFEIDPEPYQATVALRRAELAQAEAEFARAERYLKRLNASDVRGITQSELDKAESDVAVGRARVDQARAKLQLAEIDLKHCRITAPIAGKIGRTVANIGDYVAPSIGTLARIVQTDPIRVVFSVTDREYVGIREKIADEKLSEELRLRLRLPTGTVPDLIGERDFEDSAMSAETATLPVRVKFDNRNGFLVPNSYVTVLVDAKTPSEYPIVSQSALITAAEGEYVYVLGEDGKVRRRAVKTGDVENGRVELHRGVVAGERVVVEGVLSLSDGAAVQVVGERVVAGDGREDAAVKRGAGEE